MNKISAIVIAGNEEKNIEDCLQSLTWADEIILVDSESKDKTVKLAKKYTDKIFVNAWKGFSKQRVFALNLATNEWVLSLDADERVTDELKDEILSAQLNADGYKIPRRNYFLNKHITNCGWGNDYQFRLFKKSKTTVSNRPVHEGYIIDGVTEKLKGEIIHHTHISIEDTLGKINNYSSLQAEEYVNRKSTNGPGLVLHTAGAFLRSFISLKGYKDSMHGFLVSAINSLTTLQMYTKIWELKKNQK